MFSLLLLPGRSGDLPSSESRYECVKISDSGPGHVSHKPFAELKLVARREARGWKLSG